MAEIWDTFRLIWNITARATKILICKLFVWYVLVDRNRCTLRDVRTKVVRMSYCMHILSIMYSIEWIKFDRTINLPIPLINRLYTPSLQFHDLQSSIQVNRCPMLNVIVRILPSLKTMIDQTIINSNMRHEIHTKYILQTLTEYRGMIEWTKFYLGEVDSFLTQYNIISETSHNLQFWWR